MKKKKILIIVFLIFIIILTFLICAQIRLKGKTVITLNYDEVYEEPGYSSLFKVKVTNNIKNNKVGKYKVTYKNFLFKKYRTVEIVDEVKPVITLIDDNVTILLNEEYKEPGYKAQDEYDGDLTDKVEIISGLKNNQVGTYKITYKVIDSSKNSTKISRVVNVVNTLYKDEYETIDNNMTGWYTSNRQDGSRPRESEIKKYKDQNVYFLGPDKKVIYLTFDEGGNITYVKEIVDILNKHNIDATFFFSRNYISNNPDLMKKIINSGHSIGNHTVNHLSMPSLATKDKFDSYYSELKETEIAFMQATGKPMEKLFRYPMGEYSNRTMNIMKSMGYKSIFWSVAYKDWDADYNKEYSLNNMKKQLHNGAIYLIHPKCRGNYEALEDFINYATDLGYKFDLVKNI
ncbi:MAG: polysaccharide deacetylase family protein [Bacilli bacterium]|nr:polysaccharide deacetylase family protein [Bacilli bacterium]